jgi:hypothetical protein
MSADNGVYILRTPVHIDVPGEFEYRITHAMAIDNIRYEQGDWSGAGGFNIQEVQRYFGECEIFRSRTDALLEADRIADGITVLEYGISLIKAPFVFPY